MLESGEINYRLGIDKFNLGNLYNRYHSRKALYLLLLGCAIFYTQRLNSIGYANDYYAAAAQAGAYSWKAFLYGSVDFHSNVTVDKPPASLWIPSLCVRIFGLSSWSLLLPQVAMLLISVWLLYEQVERHFGVLSAWIASFFFATTPLVFVMFRYNNPEALMVLLMIAMAYIIDKAIDIDRAMIRPGICYRWLFIAGLLAGCAFLTKQLEALMSLPALAITVLFFLPLGWKKKIIGLLIAGLGLILGGGWWLALVEFIPKNDRPYIGSTVTNDFLELTFGYNGLGRIIGNPWSQFHVYGTEHYSENNAYDDSFHLSNSKPGIGRFFSSPDAAQISWLLAAAILGILVFVWFFFIRSKAQSAQKALILNWTLTLATIFPAMSFMQEAFHTYYPVIMAPAIAILAGVLCGYLWHNRMTVWAKIIALILVTITGVQYYVLYHMEDNYLGIMQWVCAAIAIVAALCIILYWRFPQKYYAYCAATVTFLATMSGPLPFSAASIPGRFPSVGLPFAGPISPSLASRWESMNDELATLERLVVYIKPNADRYRWAAASTDDAYYMQLLLGYSILPVGGFTGFDNNITLDILEKFIREHTIHFFIMDIDENDNDDSPNVWAMVSYVKKNFSYREFKTKSDDGYRVYDLSKPQ